MSDMSRRVEIGDRLQTANRRIFTWRSFLALVIVWGILDLLHVPFADIMMRAIWTASWVLAPVAIITSDVLTRPDGESALRAAWRTSRGLLVILAVLALLLIAVTVWN